MNNKIIEKAQKELKENNLDLKFSHYLLKHGDKDKYLENIRRLINKEPIQYILNNVNFYGYDFYVDKNVLIPRFETEELIYYTKEYLQEINFDDLNILDVGTGSGCIAITLKKELPTAKVDAIDISKKAINIAKKNAKKNNVNINFYEGDMLNPVSKKRKKYNVIISNPPYIKEGEKIEEIVSLNEPKLALYGGINGLKYYEEILKDCNQVLQQKYLLAFEIGSDQAKSIIKIINTYLVDVIIEVKKDMANKERFIFIKNK